ncbi:hypothetical protein ACFOUP_08150 [Belliella kenyensis]|uniref:Uncharacterized protein n=1 Tax=Belliella kenyensis TaxID=1472724 RepID=A0ABV8EJY7_9BACT|nr:hypothetical protein [Belliella kenyensis]MCH7403344.1 hypothetical protein [Belliella kenyensis]MDN3602985.1 hypothetical protein [Belliella kenyensis]
MTDQQVEENSDMVLFSEKERKAIIDSGEYPGSIYSHVFYNPSEGVFGIKLITDNREWVKFNAKGEILGTLASEENPHHTSWKMVEKELESNYFTKKPSALYIRYFAKQTYNWSRLNPFAGIGSTTGGVELNWLWIGEAFMELKLAKENIIFKTGCKLSESHGYQTVVSSYRVPKEYTQGKEVVFLYQNKYNGNEENAGWYIIIEK